MSPDEWDELASSISVAFYGGLFLLALALLGILLDALA